MNIGTIAERSGVPPKTIRYYESIGLIHPAVRGPNGYRTYAPVDTRILNFMFSWPRKAPPTGAVGTSLVVN